MKVVRNGTKLTVDLDSTSRWRFSFGHDTNSECHADLVAHVINSHYEQLERNRQADLTFKNNHIAHLERSIVTLRGHITRLKNRIKKS